MAVKRRGRRPGASGTREGIARAARRQFAELGYDRTTIRSVAAEAGVDPALVLHYFGSKQQLFLAAVDLPFDVRELIEQVQNGPRTEVGERVARFAFVVLANPDALARWSGMIRAAASDPDAAAVLRGVLTERIFEPLAEALGSDDAQLRANLASSQMVGLVMARYVIGIEPLASTDDETIASAIAPTIQRYLVEPL
ncbi:MAG: TetR family transcriptional regulator [Gaiellaceae bacterium]